MAIVLFSGGCDSTLVLHNLLKESVKEYRSITALSISHCQVPANDQNKISRDLFQIEMRKRELLGSVNFADITINNINGCVTEGSGGGLTQPIIWATMAMLYARSEDVLYFGYHKGDDFWSYRHEFETAIQNVCKICSKTVKIEYPLQDLYKYQIIRQLKERGLYDNCWYCEYPTIDNKPCGDCAPCRTHRTALWQLENFGTSGAKCGGDLQPTSLITKIRDVRDVAASDSQIKMPGS